MPNEKPDKPKREAGRPRVQIMDAIPHTFENVVKATVAPWPPKANSEEKPAKS